MKTVRVSLHISRQRGDYSSPTNSDLGTYQRDGSTYFARTRRIANTNTHSVRAESLLTKKDGRVARMQIWESQKAFQNSAVKKKVPRCLSQQPGGNIHGFALNGLKVLEGVEMDKGTWLHVATFVRFCLCMKSESIQKNRRKRAISGGTRLKVFIHT